MTTGYKCIYVRENGKLKQYLEHRYVMQQHLGRYITINEVVHHKNGNSLDNRLGNLEIIPRTEHTRFHNTKYPPYCSVKHCSRKQRSRGFCHKHYEKFMLYGDPLGEFKFKKFHQKCSIEGCEKMYHAKNLCSKHYSYSNQQKYKLRSTNTHQKE